MAQRWNYDLVLEFVQINSNSVLLSTEYKSTKSKLLFRCKCNNLFETTFEKFRLRNKRQCTSCGHNIMKSKQSLNFEDVKSKIEEFNCKLLSNEYRNTKDKLEIKCSCGDIFYKSFEKFKKTHCCKYCSYKQISDSQTFTFEYVRDFIKSSKCELMSSNYINCSSKLEIRCACNEVFSTDFNSFKNNNQMSCRKCSNTFSKGEQLIENYLIDNNFTYEKQFKFNDLLAPNKKHFLKFDFAVKENINIVLIEFDGKQHYQPVDFFGGEKAFLDLKRNDSSKNLYCEDNNIPLIRIPYYEIDNIPRILEEKLLNPNNMTIPSQA